MVQLRIKFDDGPDNRRNVELSASPNAGRSEKVPGFAALPRESLLGSIASSLAACFTPLPKVPVEWRFAPMFRSAHLTRKSRRRSLVTSLLLHAGVIACLLRLPSLPVGRRPEAPD